MGNDESFDWRDDSERFKKNYRPLSVSDLRSKRPFSSEPSNTSIPFSIIAIALIILFATNVSNCVRIGDLEERICLRERQILYGQFEHGIILGPICEKGNF